MSNKKLVIKIRWNIPLDSLVADDDNWKGGDVVMLSDYAELAARLAEVERERDALKKDAERVDFLERMSRNAGWHQENGTFAFCIDDVFVTKGTFRDALDETIRNAENSATGEER